LRCDPPGLRFLSENADFAKLCENRRHYFIGPPPGYWWRHSATRPAPGVSGRCEQQVARLCAGHPINATSPWSRPANSCQQLGRWAAHSCFKALGLRRRTRVCARAGYQTELWTRLSTRWQLRGPSAAFGQRRTVCRTLIRRARHIEVQDPSAMPAGQAICGNGIATTTKGVKPRNCWRIAPAPGRLDPTAFAASACSTAV